MKGKMTNVLLVIIFIAGLSLLLYPTVSNYYNSIHQTRAIMDYSQEMEGLEEEVYQRLLAEAQEYNAVLAAGQRFEIPEGYEEKYYSLLDASGKGVIAYVEIPSIEVTLPVMHGTSDYVLDKAVGHLEWSSLPIGGESTHCVLSGHRGLPSSELFTNIDHLEIGDVFYIHVMGQTLEYWVDNIAVVLPSEYDLLSIIEGKDYVTLMTCTPYGINSHRLLVRGVRVDREQGISDPDLYIKNEVESIDLMVVIPIILVVLSIIVFVFAVLTGGKKKKHTKKEEDKNEES